MTALRDANHTAYRAAHRAASPAAYRAAWWLPGPHSATLWGRLGRREPPIAPRIEEWDTPDGDFLEVAHLDGPGDPARTPRILVLHGLEGGLRSNYAKGLAREATSRGWNTTVLLFRTCGSRLNRLPRSYHSGETSDPSFVIDRLIARHPDAPLGLVGISLGGNVLAKLLGERGTMLPAAVRGAVVISAPYDLARASRRIGQGFGVIYERAFLRTLIPKALEKIARHAELAPLAAVRTARTLWAFDDGFTAPLHGFADAADYYARSSSLPYLARIRRPTLLLNAADDPFLPDSVLHDVHDATREVSDITLEFPSHGGHVGFTSGSTPWRPFYYAEWRALDFLAPQLGVRHD